MLKQLAREDRLRLMKFVCAFAWADLHVQPAERLFISELVKRLDLDPTETSQVESWIALPPPSDEVDPTQIPASHRKLFLEVVDGLARADGRVYRRERESIALLRDLLMA